MQHRTYAPKCHGRFPGIGLGKDRPFEVWQTTHLDTLVRGWLGQNPPCLELATFALAELKDRRAELASEMAFADQDLEPIPWLIEARNHVRGKFLEEADVISTDKRRRGSVYVILRGGYTSENGWYGAYVGSTIKPVEKRFLEHRKGVRSARGLPKYGIEPLYSLFGFVNPLPSSKDRLREWETRLHEALAPIVPKVTGDVAF
ncbi:MAG: hypothetical protein AAF468_11510 [Pseudomonadota bacterium]